MVELQAYGFWFGLLATIKSPPVSNTDEALVSGGR